MSLKNKTVFITGSSRGIGLAMGLRFAKAGANVVITGKTSEPHPKLEGTIHTAAAQIDEAGGRGLAVNMDVRNDDEVKAAVEKAVATFGGIDVLVNNASAISLTDTPSTPMKRYDLMHQVNVRGTYSVSQACLPHLLKSDNPHILNNSPPLNMDPKWFKNHVAYTMTKYGMSMCVLGMAEEFKERGIAVNALWPKTAIATAAIENVIGGKEMMRSCRKPEIMADAAYHIITKPSREVTGHFFIDEEVLAREGIKDLSVYAVDPSADLFPDFFI